MDIDRKQFLLIAAGLSQSLGCMLPPTQPAQPAQAPVAHPPVNAQPNNQQPGNLNNPNGVNAQPASNCTSWNQQRQCVEWGRQPATAKLDGQQCTQWNPRNECIAWGNAVPADECTSWDPAGVCNGWTANPGQQLAPQNPPRPAPQNPPRPVGPPNSGW